MALNKRRIKDGSTIGALISLVFVAALVPHLTFAQDKIIATYTLPDTPIKQFQNALLPGSVANDRKVLLGSVGSDLWHGPKDPRDEFWMITDRGPNGQSPLMGKIAGHFGCQNSTQQLLELRRKARRSKSWRRSRLSANPGSQ